MFDYQASSAGTGAADRSTYTQQHRHTAERRRYQCNGREVWQAESQVCTGYWLVSGN